MIWIDVENAGDSLVVDLNQCLLNVKYQSYFHSRSVSRCLSLGRPFVYECVWGYRKKVRGMGDKEWEGRMGGGLVGQFLCISH